MRLARRCRGPGPVALTVARVRRIREKGAPSRAPSKLCTQRPGSEQDPGLFLSGFNRPAHRRRQRSTRSHHRWRWTLFNKLPQGDTGTGRWFTLQLRGCSSAGRARPRHGQDMGSRPVIRSTSGVPVHSEATRQGVGGPGCARPCIPGCQATCSETPRPTGRSRSGTAEVECRVRLDGPGHHPFKVGTRVRIPHAIPSTGTFADLARRRWKSAATIGRRRNP